MNAEDTSGIFSGPWTRTFQSRPAREEHATGGVRFVSEEDRESACAELMLQRFVVARADRVATGDLRAMVEEAVESALALRGALPPAVEVGARPDVSVADQIFRARVLGAKGLAVAMPRLAQGDAPMSSADGLLLLAWLAALRAAPVVLLLDEADKRSLVMAPTPIESLALPIEPEKCDEDMKACAISMAAAPLSTRAEPAPVLDVMVAAPREIPALVPATNPVFEPEEASLEPDEEVEAAAPVDADASDDEPVEIEEVEEPHVAPQAERVVNAAEWRALAVELDHARGPKPVSVIEKLFVSSYMPLVGAMMRGEIDGAVKSVVDGWRASFEHSYRDSFASMRVTGKRPPMVFDAPDIAARIARQNGARKVVMLMVDAMRFDLGQRIGQRLSRALERRAILVDRALLWSSIPTTTPTQLRLLGRGAEGLRDGGPASESEPEIARGRAVSVIRRERAGSREIMKLDIIEARVRTSGNTYEERFDAIAEEVANAASHFILTLPPRTLVFMFGDHGFRMSSTLDGRATMPATQGGLSPEEVLVPGHAWLTGDVH